MNDFDMNKTCYLHPLIIALIFNTLSCNKGRSSEPTPRLPLNKENLVGTWIWTIIQCDPGYDFTGTGTLVTDFLGYYDACKTDDVLIFYGDGSFSMEEGISVCSPQDPIVIRAGLWIFNDSDSLLTTVDGGNDTLVYKVEWFDGNNMRTRHTEQLGATLHTFTEHMSKVN